MELVNVYSIRPDFQQYNYTTTANIRTKKVEDSRENVVKSNGLYATNSIKEVPFNPTFAASALRTRLNSNEEKDKYNKISKMVDKQTRKNLDSILKKGILLNAE